jgi:hypothetical protein
MRAFGSPINSINGIGRWNSNTGLWEVRAVAGTNFALVPGEAYRIDPTVASVTYKIVGAHDQTANTYSVITGTGAITPAFNYLSLPYHFQIVNGVNTNNAAALRGDMRALGTPINSINGIGRWNSNTGLWEVRAVAGTNFVLSAGEGYRVDPTVALVTWTCPLAVPGA